MNDVLQVTFNEGSTMVSLLPILTFFHTSQAGKYQSKGNNMSIKDVVSEAS